MDQKGAATAADELPRAWPLNPQLLIGEWMDEAHACDLLAVHADTPHTASVAARLRHRAKLLTLAARDLGLWLSGDQAGEMAMDARLVPYARAAQVTSCLHRGNPMLMQTHQYLMGVDEEIRQAMLMAMVARQISRAPVAAVGEAAPADPPR